MSVFVGRQDHVHYIQEVISGRKAKPGKLTILSIEGPVGVGKTTLFNHARAQEDLSARNYLTLEVGGNEDIASNLLNFISTLLSRAGSPRHKVETLSNIFTSTSNVLSMARVIENKALSEFRKVRKDTTKEEEDFLRQRIGNLWSVAKFVSAFIPQTRHIEFDEATKESLEKVVCDLKALSETDATIFDKLGLGWKKGLRNSLIRNAPAELAKALVSDLNAALTHYGREDRWKARRRKVNGLDRLLLWIDDYEKLRPSCEHFLISHFLPALRIANFESVIVINGRDQLINTDPIWAKNFSDVMVSPPVRVSPLKQHEVEELLIEFGVMDRLEHKRAWEDTLGYPFEIVCLVDELHAGGRTAVAMKRIHDRYTDDCNEQQRRWLYAASFLDSVNAENMTRYLKSEREAKTAATWFESCSARDTAHATFRVRPFIANRLKEYLKLTQPKEFERLERLSQVPTMATP